MSRLLLFRIRDDLFRVPAIPRSRRIPPRDPVLHAIEQWTGHARSSFPVNQQSTLNNQPPQ